MPPLVLTSIGVLAPTRWLSNEPLANVAVEKLFDTYETLGWFVNTIGFCDTSVSALVASPLPEEMTSA